MSFSKVTNPVLSEHETSNEDIEEKENSGTESESLDPTDSKENKNLVIESEESKEPKESKETVEAPTNITEVSDTTGEEYTSQEYNQYYYSQYGYYPEEIDNNNNVEDSDYYSFLAQHGGYGSDYKLSARFNARTGKFQRDPTLTPEKFSAESKAFRQMSYFFDYDKFAEQRSKKVKLDESVEIKSTKKLNKKDIYSM
ncbi:10800_t:CDS:2 [Diversispora eburnea]|uniref:10800_t:CDS:1 n=1 Tax=Diversispora eburnea TaxID=1213867 RepID=A0A9N8W9E6_9GLOM|nr:10800_t:CDS:2 [Diversispora eburnea]